MVHHKYMEPGEVKQYLNQLNSMESHYVDFSYVTKYFESKVRYYYRLCTGNLNRFDRRLGLYKTVSLEEILKYRVVGFTILYDPKKKKVVRVLII